MYYLIVCVHSLAQSRTREEPASGFQRPPCGGRAKREEGVVRKVTGVEAFFDALQPQKLYSVPRDHASEGHTAAKANLLMYSGTRDTPFK